MKKEKTVMIVDDSEIDRTILKAILCQEYEIVEKSSGFMAIDYLKYKGYTLDALLLDVFMPEIDGFAVLQYMRENGLSDIPVFLITSEATRDNVERAMQYGVSEFIRKPFERDEIIKRLRLKLGTVLQYELSSKDLWETNRYIEELGILYRRYLINFGDDVGHYTRLTDLMKIILTKYVAYTGNQKLKQEHIEIISKAGFFCDIGNMLVPPKSVKILRPREQDRDGYQKHTILGAELVALNHSKKCRYFVDICTDICMHHHERYDGKGFPHKIIGDHNLVYTQICRLAERLDYLFMQYRERSERLLEYVLGMVEGDEGNVSREVLSVFLGCRAEIYRYYHII